MTNLEQIYIVHFEPLKQRKSNLDLALSKFDNIPFTYKIMNKESDNISKKVYHDVFSTKERGKKISFQELTVSLTHLEIYKDIVNKEYKTCLILEDDAILDDLFFSNIQEVLKESINYDFIFLSSCCNLHAPKIKNSILQDATSSRSVCGYIVQLDCLKKVIKACEPFSDVIDWQLNHIKNDLNLRYAWSEPPLIKQGSEQEFESNLHNVRIDRVNNNKI